MLAVVPETPAILFLLFFGYAHLAGKGELSKLISGYAAVSNGRLYYEYSGDGKPVLLIHAGFLDSRMWDKQFWSFSKSHRVIRYDVRGFGRSDRPGRKFSDAEDLRALLAELEIKASSIVGLSNGGRIALDFAVEHPEMVSSLILVGPGVSGYTESGPEEERLWAGFNRLMRDQEEAVKENRIADAVGIDVDIWASAQKPKTLKRIRRIAMENEYAYLNDPGMSQVSPLPPAFERLSEITAPTLIIVGDRDFPGMQLVARRINQMIPRSSMVIIPGADHLVNLSRPLLFERAVQKFLAAQ